MRKPDNNNQAEPKASVKDIESTRSVGGVQFIVRVDIAEALLLHQRIKQILSK